MGNAQMGVSQRLLTCVERGQMWVEMLTGVNVRAVDVLVAHKDTYSQTTQFEAELLCSIPKNISLVFLFPRSETVLHTRSYGTLEALNKRCNEVLRLKASASDGWRQGEAQVAICWMDHMFRVSGLRLSDGSDKFYLVWASQISIYEGGDREVRKTGDMPLVVCTDGHFGIIAVYPLVHCHDNHFIDRKRILWINPSNYPMFTCDTPLPPPTVIAQNYIARLSEAEAKERRERTTVPEHEKHPVASATLNGGTDRGGSGDDDDAVNEFFEDALASAEMRQTRVWVAPLPSVEDRVVADVHNAEIARSLKKETKVDDFDAGSSSGGEIIGLDDTPPQTPLRFTEEPLSSPARRGRIPIGILSRDSHRTKNIGRVRLRTSAPSAAAVRDYPARQVAAAHGSPITSGQTSSDSELVPMSELRPPPEKPANVSNLPLDKLVV